MQRLRTALKRAAVHPTTPFLALVLVLSYFTYFHGYWQPNSLFWDENYHIAAAQKEIHGIFYMEPHPPLGKQLIALGEWLLHPNEASDQFLSTDYGKNPPAGFSFAGYRLFPTLLAWLTAPLLFGVFLLITGNRIFALFLSFLYIFDNAIIVHSRSAMVDQPLFFFGSAAILLMLLLARERAGSRRFWVLAALMGACLGAAAATKVNGLILVLLVPYLLWIWRRHWRSISTFAIAAMVGFTLLYVGSWQTHFARGSTIDPHLPDQGYYKASAAYKQIVQTGRTGNIAHFPVMLRDSLKFLPHYQRGVPKLDLCKSGENGSPFFLWPIGARTIRYRWNHAGSDGAYRYLYLVPNPAGWALGLLGVILAVSIVLGSLLLPVTQRPKELPLLLLFLAIYGGYMGAMARIDRVMYMYHYFLPLIISFLLFGLSIKAVTQLWNIRFTDSRKTVFLYACGIAAFLGFQFMRPFTYYEPILNETFKSKQLLRLWDMNCINCQRDNPLVKKTCE